MGGGDCGVGLKTDDELRQKWVIFLPSISLWIPNIIQIWDGRKKLAVEIQKSLCRGLKADNLIESTCFYLKLVNSTCFYLKICQVHGFCLNFSRVRIFCNNNYSKLVPYSTQPGVFPSWTIVDNLTKNSKVKFIIETKGNTPTYFTHTKIQIMLEISLKSATSPQRITSSMKPS